MKDPPHVRFEAIEPSFDGFSDGDSLNRDRFPFFRYDLVDGVTVVDVMQTVYVSNILLRCFGRPIAFFPS